MIDQLTQLAFHASAHHGLGFPADYKNGTKSLSIGDGIAYGLIGVGAGCAMAAAIGTGAGQGIAAGRAAEAVGRNPEAESRIRNMMIIGDGIAESSAIYGLIIAILLLFVF